MPPRSELPHYGTRFFGREAEKQAFAAHLDGPERLLSVVGTGGVGKTRFVVESLSTPTRQRKVIFCDLADARSITEALSQIAVRLGLRLSGPSSKAALADLAGRAVRQLSRVVIILDNYEQLVGKADGLIEGLLAAAPEARFVVTSRVRLGVAGERVLELEPLPTDGDRADTPSPALLLWRDRVELSTGTSELTLLDAGESLELVRELEGLPLAIELLAPRARVLGPREIRKRLPQGLALEPVPGSKGKRNSVRAALEGSWSLLGTAEQDALARSSVFRGGFTATALDAVLRTAHLGRADESGVASLDLLQTLRDHSLVTLAGGLVSGKTGGAARRLRLLTLIRDFAAEKLAIVPDAREDAEARHAAFFADLFDVAQAAEQTGDISELDRLRDDRDNLIAVAERASSPTASPTLVRFGLSALAVLDVLVFTKGIALTHGDVLETLPERALEIANTRAPELREGGHLERGLFARARARLVGGHADDARRDLDALVATCRNTGDRVYEGRALYLLASHAVRSGHAGNEVELYEQALALHRATGDRTYEGRCLVGLGANALAKGRTKEAIELSESALHLFIGLGDRSYEALVRASLANIHSERGEYKESRAHLEKALEVHRKLGHRRFEGFDWYGMGLLEHGLGRHEQALAAYETASTICLEVGDVRYAAAFRGYGGMCLATLGRVEEALARFIEAQHTLRESGDGTYAAFFLACSAASAALGGRPEAARDSFARAETELSVTPLSSVGAVFSVLHGLLDFASAQLLGDPAQRAERVRIARELAAPRAPDEPKELRFARAWMRSEIDRLAAEDRAPGALRVHDQGHWFELPNGPRIPCGARAAMGRILLALALRRLASPGESLSRADLIRAGWPDERILAGVEANRLHVTIRRLRKLGLGPLLETSDAGYRLGVGVTVRIVSGV